MNEMFLLFAFAQNAIFHLLLALMQQIPQFTLILIAIVGFLAISSLLVSLFALAKSRKIKKDLEVLFSGKKAQDLETIILNQSNEIKALDKEIQELFEISNKINKLAFKGVHKVGLIRFNPFKDIGGDQSFAIAMLDGSETGLVISSLHKREGTRVYAKPVKKGESKRYTLTEEEKKAIKSATIVHKA